MRGYDELTVMIEDIYKKMYREIFDANRTGDEDELDRVLKKWNYDSGEEDVYDDMARQKVLVIGKSEVEQKYLERIVESLNMDVGQFDFRLGYEHNFDFSTLKNSTTFSDVIVGAMGHKQKGGGDSNSAISELELNPYKYPNVVKCLTTANKLKITKQSFHDAILNTNAYAYMQLGLES